MKLNSVVNKTEYKLKIMMVQNEVKFNKMGLWWEHAKDVLSRRELPLKKLGITGVDYNYYLIGTQLLIEINIFILWSVAYVLNILLIINAFFIWQNNTQNTN